TGSYSWHAPVRTLRAARAARARDAAAPFLRDRSAGNRREEEKTEDRGQRTENSLSSVLCPLSSVLCPSGCRSWGWFRLHLGHGQALQDLVDDAVLQRFLGRQELIAIGFLLDLFERLAAVPDQDLVEDSLVACELLNVDQNLRGRAFGAGQRLVDHDAR